jgi:hypothetical protein
VGTAPGYLGQFGRRMMSDHDHAGPLGAGPDVTAKLPLLLASRLTDLFVAAVDDTGRTRGAAIPLAASRITLMS